MQTPADNGVAIAAMLALAESDAPHGPLELLMTVAEEVGMAGAAELDPALIGGSVLLNLGSEEDATLTVGCAGGAQPVQQYLAAGLLDELYLHIVPVVLGGGVRLLENVRDSQLGSVKVVASPAVTHVKYRVIREATAPRDGG